jgi:hypothetical protein
MLGTVDRPQYGFSPNRFFAADIAYPVGCRIGMYDYSRIQAALRDHLEALPLKEDM